VLVVQDERAPAAARSDAPTSKGKLSVGDP
jgi:hypothetical protein